MWAFDKYAGKAPPIHKRLGLVAAIATSFWVFHTYGPDNQTGKVGGVGHPHPSFPYLAAELTRPYLSLYTGTPIFVCGVHRDPGS